MSERYGRKDADAAFRSLCKATGHEEGPNWRRVDWAGEDSPEWAGRSQRNVAEVGTWYLDYAACYGGYVVNQVSNESGGVSQPFGPMRHSARDFVTMVRFAIDALRSLETSTMDRLPV